MKKRVSRFALLLCGIGILLVGVFIPLQVAAAGTETEAIQSLDDLSGKQVGITTGSVFDVVLLERVPNAK